MLIFDLFMARSNLLPCAFVQALYIYLGKSLRIHILDVSSKYYNLIELKLDEEHRVPSKQKIAKTEPIENPRWPPDSPS